MSIARHHAEWLSLVEVSGPFLSMPVLMRVFPQGLEAHDPDHVPAAAAGLSRNGKKTPRAGPKPGHSRQLDTLRPAQTLGFPTNASPKARRSRRPFRPTSPNTVKSCGPISS